MAIRIPNLPTELIEEILARLPVKSLLRFKSVSKSWCSLIPSKDFVKAHIEISSKDTSFSNYRIINPTRVNLRQFSLNSLLFEPSTPAVVLDYPLYEIYDFFCVVGCCNGLVCILADDKDFILWNPSTKQYKKLPRFDHTSPEHEMFLYGFGYDDCSDDYKVFGALPLSDDSYPVHSVSKVYSLNMDSWRKVDDITTNLPVDLQGKLACNNLHWIRSNGKASEGKWNILSFDLEREVFGMVDLPGSMDYLCDPSLDKLKGCLCLLCQYYFFGRLDVWMLKQYGVKESWNKMLSITFPGFPYPDPIPFHRRIWGPLWVGDNGDILLLSCDSSFIFYYPKDDRWFSKDYRSHTRFSNLEYIEEVIVYVESLVSPCAHRGVGTGMIDV